MLLHIDDISRKTGDDRIEQATNALRPVELVRRCNNVDRELEMSVHARGNERGSVEAECFNSGPGKYRVPELVLVRRKQYIMTIDVFMIRLLEISSGGWIDRRVERQSHSFLLDAGKRKTPENTRIVKRVTSNSRPHRDSGTATRRKADRQAARPGGFREPQPRENNRARRFDAARAVRGQRSRSGQGSTRRT
ncbi:hypothetical protein RirG_012170 [Rhizophagus irregularis DAOM 197198w]|uniref:Uncharacterized protein n=1 Tax=Rhizophagus irregularis (strain DAOM 197198w) TaxID=1432141 RepID=A0A015LGI2_RHIIW|nr:hypothetical protein RirG_012170 [Rhizophagus irregularis DAOM 197198w]